ANLTEHSVNAIQVPGVCFTQHHEELAAAGVLPGMRHGQGADGVLVRVPVGFTGNSPPWAAGANTPVAFGQVARQRIAALHDKVGNDAMKLHAIVEAAVGELLEILHRLWRFARKQLSDDGAFVCLESSQLCQTNLEKGKGEK